MKFAHLIFLLAIAFATCSSSVAESWIAEAPGAARSVLTPDENGWVTLEAALPAGGAIYRETPRESFRPDRSVWKRFLRVDVELTADSALPAELFIFVKDKDGFYFQSVDSYPLAPGESKTLEIELERHAGAWRPVGHPWEWNALVEATIFNAGIQLAGPGSTSGAVKLRCRNLRFEERRPGVPLTVDNWHMPKKTPALTRFESRFDLSREYFNPFDPDLIAVDATIRMPSGESVTFPAFYGQDYRREKLFSSEQIEPVGHPYWAFRFTPPVPGEYEVFLQAVDSTGKKARTVTTAPRRFTVTASDAKGFVRIDERSGNFFRFDNGQPFYPVGLNIHTNIDLRSENVFGFAPQSDEGTYDYDAYLEACAANGINTVEIWMAAWAFALEWDSARNFYYGMGRYNLANAWRLDQMMERAEALDMYYHLNLDNHGKISSHADPEWQENPLNEEAPFAVANGGVLKKAGQFFAHDNDGTPAAEYYRKRNRYIAARWGAEPRIFGIEFWNEINLTDGFQKHYETGRVQAWHEHAAQAFRSQDTGRHLLTTHVCSDFNTNLNFRKLWEDTSLDYVVGDAYYDSNGSRLFIDLLKSHAEAMTVFGKPTLITEFGGSSSAGPPPRVTADLHSSLWGAFFLGQSGTPFLWWHDFVHLRHQYPHYAGFSRFIAGIDRGDPAWQMSRPATNAPEGTLETLAFGRADAAYLWVFRRDAMYSYPEKPEEAPLNASIVVSGASAPLQPGQWRADFFHTVTGEVLGSHEFKLTGDQLELPLPEFRIDCAAKLTRMEKP